MGSPLITPTKTNDANISNNAVVDGTINGLTINKTNQNITNAGTYNGTSITQNVRAADMQFWKKDAPVVGTISIHSIPDDITLTEFFVQVDQAPTTNPLKIGISIIEPGQAIASATPAAGVEVGVGTTTLVVTSFGTWNDFNWPARSRVIVHFMDAALPDSGTAENAAGHIRSTYDN